MEYKLNRYLYIKEKNDILVIYNLLNNTLFALNREKYLALKTDNLSKLKVSHPTLFSAMEKLDVIVPYDFEEVNQVKLLSRKTLFDTRQYRLTINPTLECNFNCWYCYEEHPKGRMSEDTMQSVINHIKLKIKDDLLQHLNLDWFGGEPFLYFDEIVYPLSKTIKTMVEEKGKSFLSIATTNGYLLDEARISKLQEIGLTQFQITLDGDESMHNKIRHNKHNDSFRKIIENINLLSEYPNNNIMIRINYTEKTLVGINEIMKFFSEKAKERVVILFQQVWQDSAKKNISCENNMRDFEEAGFKIRRGKLNTSGVTCYADYLQQAVVNFDGRVFKCTARDFNATKEDGILLPNGEIQWDMSLFAKRMGHATFENKFCMDCNVLPVCMGPCSQKMLELTNEEDFKPICLKGGVKKILEENIETFYNSLNLIS